MGDMLSKNWREYQLDLDKKEWDRQTVETLSDEIEELAGLKNEVKPKLKIILLGHLGSGKSSLINSFLAALTGVISNIAVEGGTKHTTEKFNEFPAYTEDGRELDFAFYDVRGTGRAAEAASFDDCLRAILGKKTIGEKFVPRQKYADSLDDALVDEDTSHVILYVLDGSAVEEKKKQEEDDKLITNLKELKSKTDHLNLSLVDCIRQITKLNTNSDLFHTWRVLHADQKVLILPQHPASLPFWKLTFAQICDTYQYGLCTPRPVDKHKADK